MIEALKGKISTVDYVKQILESIKDDVEFAKDNLDAVREDHVVGEFITLTKSDVEKSLHSALLDINKLLGKV